MRAVVIRGYDGPAGIATADVPRPVPGDPFDVVVAVKAAALNHLDLFVTRGLPGLTHDFPFVLGSDGAGVVEAVGSGVTTVKPGDKVLINPGVWCGRCEFCLAGEQPLCPTYGIIGEHRPGAMAEAICVPEVNVTRLEAEVSWPEAAAFGLATLTAWRMVATRGEVQAGQSVLIQGIGGGVALAALQVAKLLGARVIVTSTSDDKLARAKSLGADEGLNNRTQDVLKEVRRLTAKRGVDVVIDSIGEATWETSLRCLCRGGRLVTCGGTSGPIVKTDLRKLFWYQWNIVGSTMGNHAEWTRIAGLFGRGLLRPVVDSVLGFDQAKDAFLRMDAGGQFGKLVVEIG